MPIQSHDPTEHMDPEPSYCDAFGIPMSQPHFVAIGRFLISCARIEVVTSSVLRALLPVTDQLARMLIGQPRLDDLLDTIGRTCNFTNANDAYAKAFTECRGHITYIYKVRNLLAHHEPAWREGWLRYDRYAVAKDVRDRVNLIHVMRLEELDNLTEFGISLASEMRALIMNWNDCSPFSASALIQSRALFKTRPLPPDPGKPYRRP